jgi:hypothetical protein
LTLSATLASDDAELSSVVAGLLNNAFLVQSDGEKQQRYAYFILKGSSSAAIDEAIGRLDRRMIAARIGRAQRIRIAMPPPLEGKWTRFNLETPASNDSDAVPLFRKQLMVERLGLPRRRLNPRRYDKIEEFYLANSLDVSELGN